MTHGLKNLIKAPYVVFRFLLKNIVLPQYLAMCGMPLS
jgi:hypothetical protein